MYTLASEGTSSHLTKQIRTWPWASNKFTDTNHTHNPWSHTLVNCNYLGITETILWALLELPAGGTPWLKDDVGVEHDLVPRVTLPFGKRGKGENCFIKEHVSNHIFFQLSITDPIEKNRRKSYQIQVSVIKFMIQRKTRGRGKKRWVLYQEWDSPQDIPHHQNTLQL